MQGRHLIPFSTQMRSSLWVGEGGNIKATLLVTQCRKGVRKNLRLQTKAVKLNQSNTAENWWQEGTCCMGPSHRLAVLNSNREALTLLLYRITFPQNPLEISRTIPHSFWEQSSCLQTANCSPYPAALLFLQSGVHEKICTYLLDNILLLCGKTCKGIHVSNMLRTPNKG